MKNKIVYVVAGARPNFMKIAPLIRAIKNYEGEITYKLIHTGQHYDKQMSDVFFEELGIPRPDFHLDCGGGSHAVQTAKIMVEFEKICMGHRPCCVIVVGDVNSTVACSLVAKKLHIKVAHIEAGLRSGDISMPEEINRLVTDSISDFYYCTEQSAVDNLKHEGKSGDVVVNVGNVMIDNLLYQKNKLSTKGHFSELKNKLLHFEKYAVVTLHRPSNVDNAESIRKIESILNIVSSEIPLVFPVHPRTLLSFKNNGVVLSEKVIITEPLPYMEFLNIWKDALFVMTDSGGLQEETTALQIPCLTLRSNTERPVTLTEGSNVLTGLDVELIMIEIHKLMAGNFEKSKIPNLWDGNAAARIISDLFNRL